MSVRKKITHCTRTSTTRDIGSSSSCPFLTGVSCSFLYPPEAKSWERLDFSNLMFWCLTKSRPQRFLIRSTLVDKSEKVVVSHCTSSVQTAGKQLFAASKWGLEISWPLWTSRSHAFLCKLHCILVPRTPLYTLAVWFLQVCSYDDCGVRWHNIELSSEKTLNGCFNMF